VRSRSTDFVTESRIGTDGRRAGGHSTDGERMHGWMARGWKSALGWVGLSVRRDVGGQRTLSPRPNTAGQAQSRTGRPSTNENHE
jgi:hypothetical protein